MRTSHTATDVGTMVHVPKKGNSTGNYQQWILIWGLFPLCAVDTESLWMACLHKSAVPQKDFLASNFLCLFYFFVSKLELFTRPPWEWQSNVDETKYPAFIDKTSRREWVYAFACVWVCLLGRDSTILKCWHLLQALAGMECDTLLYTKGLGPCSRHKRTSIGPPPWRQHTHKHTHTETHTMSVPSWCLFSSH